MEAMAPSPVETVDLLDLKLLPAWVKEPAEPKSYAAYTAEEERRGSPPRRQRDRNGKRRTSKTDRSRAGRQQLTPKVEKRHRDELRQRSGARDGRPRGAKNRHRPDGHPQLTRTPQVTVRFLPYSLAF